MGEIGKEWMRGKRLNRAAAINYRASATVVLSNTSLQIARRTGAPGRTNAEIDERRVMRPARVYLPLGTLRDVFISEVPCMNAPAARPRVASYLPGEREIELHVSTWA